MRDMHADDEANDAAQGPAQQDRPRCDWGLGDYQYPLTPELVCDPVYTAEFAANMEKWRLGLEEIIEHATDALPFQQTIYDKACLAGECESHEHYTAAAKMSEAFCKMKGGIEVCAAFLIKAEGVQDLFSKCVLVAHRSDKPLRLVLLRATPSRTTRQWDLDSGVNLPWTLKFERVNTNGHEHLDFRSDKAFFLEVQAECAAWDAQAVVCQRLDTRPISMEEFEVVSLGPPLGLLSLAVEDLRELLGEGRLRND